VIGLLVIVAKDNIANGTVICGFGEIVNGKFPLEFDPYAIIAFSRELGRDVYVAPGEEFGPFINDGVPIAVNGKAQEPNCRLDVRTVNRKLTALVIATKNIDKG
jgi:hypothetical protein